ncbi:MAG: acyl-CoA reductase [Saprospiraceae bacterium]|nr:acyl-CoA reductase [Saprospiraceae bacterium]
MEGLTRKEKIEVLAALGAYLLESDERLAAHVHRASVSNPWFTKENIYFALDSIAREFLDAEALHAWLAHYPERPDPLRTVGLIAAGNVPLVGFHDVLSVFAAGHRTQLKVSERDQYLIPFLLKRLGELDPRAIPYFEIAETLSGFDAVIATGSNNSARYFKQYFGKYPHIIRMNRNAVAVLDGNESEEQLRNLCTDIFRFFGLGCRSVSHLFVPEGYEFDDLRQALQQWEEVSQHHKFRNNLDYNSAIYILNKEPHIGLPNLLLVEKEPLISPVGCLFYSHYASTDELERRLLAQAGEIQCVVSDLALTNIKPVPLGQAQRPRLDDYADGVNTLDFLFNLA